MTEELTVRDLEFILTSLAFTRQKFEDTSYPTYDLRIARLKEVDDIITKIRALKQEKSKESSRE